LHAEQHSSFTLDGSTQSSNGALPAGTYTAGVAVTMSGVINSGTCYPVTVTGQTSGGTPTIAVNGSTNGPTVSPGARALGLLPPASPSP